MSKYRESDFQSSLVRALRQRFPGCIVLKNDANYLQGIPDLSVFYGSKWAMLECKKSANEPFQPNQQYYIDLARQYAFGSVIYPENMEEVLDELERSFKA